MQSPLLILLAEHVGVGWRPGIGDPSIVAWVTVVAYFASAVLCWKAGDAERRLASAGLAVHPIFWRSGFHRPSPAKGAASVDRRVFFWQALAISMTLLGINKQLDLQSLIPIIGRQVAHAQGWYENRQVVQRAFISGIAISGLGALALVAFLFRSVMIRRPMAPLGLIFLFGFILVRASSFHKVDVLLSSDVLGMRANWLFELSGIFCVLISALACVIDGRQATGRR